MDPPPPEAVSIDEFFEDYYKQGEIKYISPFSPSVETKSGEEESCKDICSLFLPFFLVNWKTWKTLQHKKLDIILPVGYSHKDFKKRLYETENELNISQEERFCESEFLLRKKSTLISI